MIISLSLVYLLVYMVGGREVFVLLVNANIIYIIYALCLFLLSLLIKAFTWYILQKAKYPRLSLLSTFPVWTFGYALSIALPGKTGEIVRLEIHRRYQDLAIGDSASIIFFTRIYDLLFLITFSALGVIVVMQQYFLSLNIVYFTILIFSLLCFVIIFAVLVAWKRSVGEFLLKTLHALLRKMPSRMQHITERINKFAIKELDNFYESVELYKTLQYPLFVVPLLTALRWLIELFATILIFRSIGASVSIWTIALAISVSIFVGIATVMPASLGTGTLAGFAIYRVLGIAADIAVAATLIGLFLGPGITISLGIASLIFLELRQWFKLQNEENK
ncbi:MAG: lysylphosphatidylglycerol synthase transmembrane domain-containing protein [Promethearchaeota archaeon]